MTGYATAPADAAADRERLLALWKTGLAHNGMPVAKLDWYYGSNPEGVPAVLFLRAGDAEPVGAASLGTRRMQWHGKALSAGILGDFVVIPGHRSFFPALTLQKALLRRGLADHALIFGMPNPHSEAIVRRAGYRRIGAMVRRARVLRSSRYFSRHMPAWLGAILGAVADRVRVAVFAARARGGGALGAEWLDRPDGRFDALWERAAPAARLAGVRDARFLAWRFADCPLHRHRFIAVYARPSRELVAYAACQMDGATMHVRDFLADARIPEAGPRLWLEIAREAWRGGHASASVEFMGDPAVQRQIEDSGWVERDRRSLYAAFEGHDALLDEAAWYVTQADEDG